MTKTVYKVELKKLFLHKTLLIAIILFILVSLCAVVFSVFAENNFAVGKTKEVIVNSEFIQADISNMEKQLANSELSKRDRYNLQLSLASAKFFLKSNTEKTSYYSDTFDTRDGGALLMNRFFLYGTILTSFFAILSPVIMFGGEYNGRFRMSILQGIRKKSLFLGKTLSAITVFAIILLIFATVGLICALFSPKTVMLTIDYFNISVNSTPVLIQYLANFLAMFIGGIFLFSLTIFLCTVFQNQSIALGSIAAFFLICFILIRGIKTIGYRQSAFFPVIGILQLSQSSFSLAYAIGLTAHVSLAVAFYVFAYALFRRQSF